MALKHRASAKLCSMVQGTELSQRAPPVFCWAAITLGIGPHSSFLVKCHQLFILLFLQTRSVCIYVFVSFVIFAYFIAATLVK